MLFDHLLSFDLHLFIYLNSEFYMPCSQFSSNTIECIFITLVSFGRMNNRFEICSVVFLSDSDVFCLMPNLLISICFDLFGLFFFFETLWSLYELFFKSKYYYR